MRYFVLIALFLLNACAARKAEIDPRALKYADLWEGIYGVEVVSDVRFHSLSGDTVGLCSSSGDPEESKITIDPEFWDQATENEREELMFHEFGHCLLNLGHDSSLIEVGGKKIPKSIMYPYVIGDTVYSPNQNYYREELKTSQAREK